MLKCMKKGSVVVDLAAERGGNVEGTIANQKTYVEGVTLIGYIDHASRVPVHASQLLTKNITTFFLNMANEGELNIDMEDDRSEEHTSELQSRPHLVCRLLLEKKKIKLNTC